MAKKSTAARKAAATQAEVPDTTAPEESEKTSTHLGEDVQKGDFILVDVLGKLKNGKAFHATNKKDAVREGIFEEKHQYGPDLVILGEKGFLLPGILEDLESNNWKVGDERTIDLTAENAFGKREGSKLRQMGVKEFKKKTGQLPKPGAEIRDQKTGETGYVMRMGQGRLLIDYNHPLAGKEVTYTIKVLDKVTEEMEKIKAFIAKNAPGMQIELLKIERKDSDLEIEIPQAYMFQNLMYFKLNVGLELTRYIEGIERVKFIEIFEKIPVREQDSTTSDQMGLQPDTSESAIAEESTVDEPTEDIDSNED